MSEIEEWSFGADAWSLRQLAALKKPQSNKLIDVVWTLVPGEAPAAADPSAPAAPCARAIAGYVGYRITLDGDDRLACYISSMAVCPSFRGRGFGRVLLRHVLDYARMRCCWYAVLHVRASNVTAQRLYQSQGFRVDRVVPEYYHTSADGYPEDGFLMIADVASPRLQAVAVKDAAADKGSCGVAAPGGATAASGRAR